jgi:hypothetical protein
MLVVLVFVLAAPAAAQDDAGGDAPNPLLDMLSLVPDAMYTTEDELSLSYANLGAISPAHGAPQYESYAQWETEGRDTDGRWMWGLFRINTGPEFLQYVQVMGGLKELAGFDLFEIEHSVSIGQPPETLTILSGVFDVDAMDAALTEMGYAAQEPPAEGVIAWRRADGEDDMTMDLAGREPAYPFGGHLGQLRPVAAIPGAGDTIYLASSNSWDLAMGAVTAWQGEASTLAERRDYRTLAEAVGAQGRGTAQTSLLGLSSVSRDAGYLMQAQYVDGLAMPFVDLSGITRDQWDEAEPLRDLGIAYEFSFVPEWCDYGTLPRFSLALIADRQEGENQVVLLALYYEDTEIARSAAEVLKMRLEKFTGYFTMGAEEPFLPQYIGESGTVEAYTYTSETTGGTAAVVAITYPLPSPEIPEGEVMRTYPGLAFRLWIQVLYRREMYPFWHVQLADWMYGEFCE